MTTPELQRDFIRDMVEAAWDAQEFVQDMEFADFSTDAKTRLAVAMAIGIIGEAAKNVPKEIRDHYPDAPWGLMTGMRDVLFHKYFGIEWELVWQTVHQDIPALLVELRQIDA